MQNKSERVVQTDGTQFYTRTIDADRLFNHEEITLSNIFRGGDKYMSCMPYGEALHQFCFQMGLMRPDVLEIGAGNGTLANDFMRKHVGWRNYHLMDISESLLEYQREHVKYAKSFRQADARLFSQLGTSPGVPWFCGLIIANAFIADLESEQADPGVPGSMWCHPGAEQFIVELYGGMLPGSAAVLLDFQAVPQTADCIGNQPAVFVDSETGEKHYKCGVDFSQLERFAQAVGFSAYTVTSNRFMSVPQRWGFLSTDFWTRSGPFKDYTDLYELLEKQPIEVRAYTERALVYALGMRYTKYTVAERDYIINQLAGHYHRLDDPRFDSLNPHTWVYSALVLEKDS